MEREKELVAYLSLLQPKMTGANMIKDLEHLSLLPAQLNPCYIALDNYDSIDEHQTVLNPIGPVNASARQSTIGDLNGVYAYFICKSNPGLQEEQEGQVFLMLQSTFFVSDKPRFQSRHGVFKVMTKPFMKQTKCGQIQNILGGEITFRHGTLIRWNAQSTVYSLGPLFNHTDYLAEKDNNLPKAYESLEKIASAVKTVKLPYDKFTIYPYEQEDAPFIKDELSSLEEKIGRSVPQLPLNHIPIPDSSKRSPTSVDELIASPVQTPRPSLTDEHPIKDARIYRKVLSSNRTKSVNEDTDCKNEKTVGNQYFISTK